MTDFIEIIDIYLSRFSTYTSGMVEFECKYGELTFYKPKSNTIIVHAIYVFPEYRQSGLCRRVLQHLIETTPKIFKKVCVQSVLSNILYNYLLRFTHNNKNFTLSRYGFECLL